jgi:hypothetical protein
MSKTKENEMLVLSFGYGEYVLSAKDAVTIMEILQKAERYECKYVSGGDNTHHIYPSTESGTAKIISDDLYRMAKLAGKPER